MNTGIDVSAWQGDIDWQKARANGAVFAFIKASQQLFLDRCFTANWQGARAADLPRGAYHYLTWDAAPDAQAAFFARALKADPGELPPVVDFEEATGCPANAALRLRTFIEGVEAALGRACMIYTSPGFWQTHGSRDPFFAERPLWLAHWGVSQPAVPLPWRDYAFWQFTNRGDGPAYGVASRAVDCSHANPAWDGLSPAGMGEPVSTTEQLTRLWVAHPELHVSPSPK